jgi:hypothetical protein
MGVLTGRTVEFDKLPSITLAVLLGACYNLTTQSRQRRESSKIIGKADLYQTTLKQESKNSQHGQANRLREYPQWSYVVPSGVFEYLHRVATVYTLLHHPKCRVGRCFDDC